MTTGTSPLVEARAKRNRYGWLLTPYTLLLLALLVLPVFNLIEISLRQHAPLKLTGEGFTLSNYSRLGDSYYFRVLFDTLKMSLASTAIALVLGYPVAYFIARADRWKAIFTLLVTIPLMTSVVVKVLGWYIALGPRSVLTDLISGIVGHPVRLLNSQGAVLVGLVEFALPFMILSLTAALERIPRSLEEAASNLGASPVHVLFTVLLPLSVPGIISGFLLCFGVSASAYVVPAVLGGTSIRMAAQEVYDLVQAAFNWPAASALAVVVLLILSAVIYIATRVGASGDGAK